jgi:hypothetical protein
MEGHRSNYLSSEAFHTMILWPKLTHTSLSPIRRGFAPGFVNCEKGCTRLAAASDKAYQLLAHGLFFSPGNNKYI